MSASRPTRTLVISEVHETVHLKSKFEKSRTFTKNTRMMNKNSRIQQSALTNHLQLYKKIM